MSSVILPIIIANIIMFALQIITGNSFTNALILRAGDLVVRPWTLVTSMFLHGSVLHIFFNMYVLFMFGPLLEQRIGPKRFLLIYFVSGILAALISQFIYPAALGASGAIMGIIGVVIMLLPNLRVLFFFVIPMPLWIAGIVIAAIDIFGALGCGGQVANVAHLVGLGCGLFYGWLLKGQKRKFHRKFEQKSYMSSDDVDEYLRSGRI